MDANDRLNNRDGQAAREGCRCPEVRIDKRWFAFCEATGGTIPDLRSPEPLGWRCPDCKRGLLRVDVKESDDLPDAFRIDFCCSAQACGWHEYVLRTTW